MTALSHLETLNAFIRADGEYKETVAAIKPAI